MKMIGMLPENVVLLLPGQGAQHPRMAADLYGVEQEFTSEMDRLLNACDDDGERLRRTWLDPAPGAAFDDAPQAQPLLFALGYALGRALLGRGIQPTVLLGHSVGELSAAALAEVWPATAASWLMAARARILVGAPDGGMLAVHAGVDEIRRFVPDLERPDAVKVAAVNAPRQTIMAGTEPALSEAAARLRAAGLTARPIRARQPFHHPAFAPVADEFARWLAEIPARPPRILIQSARTAALVEREQAVSAEFWAGQLVTPVLFWPALHQLLRAGEHLLLDASPGQALGVLARQHPAVRCGRARVISLLPVSPRANAAATWHAALEQLSAG